MSEEKTFLGELRQAIKDSNSGSSRRRERGTHNRRIFLVNHAEEIAALVEAAWSVRRVESGGLVRLYDALDDLDRKTRAAQEALFRKTR